MPSSLPSDFDFLFGSWTVVHRRLRTRLQNSSDWDVFPGTSETRPVLGGLGNIEDNVIGFPGGSYRAMAVRSYDSETGSWAIWWLDRRNPHVLDVPVIGGFENGVGIFLAEDQFAGKPVKVRFCWSEIGAASCKWEQAFSPDGGTNWESNWTMHFTRLR